MPPKVHRILKTEAAKLGMTLSEYILARIYSQPTVISGDFVTAPREVDGMLPSIVPQPMPTSPPISGPPAFADAPVRFLPILPPPPPPPPSRKK